MNKRGKIIVIVFSYFLLIPLAVASNIKGDTYSIGDHHIGLAGDALFGINYSAEDVLTYQQALNNDAFSDTYSLSLGYLEGVTVVGAPEEVPVVVTPGGGGGSSTGGGGGGSIIRNVTEEAPEVFPEELFDIAFNLEDRLIDDASELIGIIDFESFGNIPTLVDLTYIILDEDGNEVYREAGNITVITQEILRKTFERLELPDGEYTFVLETLYGDNVFDEFRQEFEIGKRRGITGRAVDWIGGEGRWWLIGTITTLLVIGLTFWLIWKKKYHRAKRAKRHVKRKKHRPHMFSQKKGIKKVKKGKKIASKKSVASFRKGLKK
jgi:hypothetical protein